jgi:hypothetical protein
MGLRDLRDLPNPKIATIALAALGGAHRKVPTEEVAELAHSWAPDRFSWQMAKYRERGWPDKELVGNALVDAWQKETPELVAGRKMTDLAKDGWRLTAAGAEFARPYIAEAASPHGSDERGRASRDERRVVRRVLDHRLYRRFADTGSLRDVSPYEFREFLNLGPDAPRTMVERAFERLRVTATLAGDDQLLAFVDACAASFPDVVGRTDPDDTHKEGPQCDAG